MNSTSITINTAAPPKKIDPRIYGHFLEELGRMITGGLFPSPGAKVETIGIGYWKEVWEACRDLHPILLRWPGGCFADTYRWENFIGEDRPHRAWNRYWGKMGPLFGPPLREELGTDEFLKLCRDWNCEGYFCANFGSGTAHEAARWVEYLKEKEGPSAPRLWSIGNEQFGLWEPGHRPPKKYGRRYKIFRHAMKSADPRIETVANGADTYNLKWNQGLLEEAADEMDYLSIHIYLPQDYNPRHIILPAKNTVEEWYNLLAIDHTLRWKLQTIEDQCKKIAGRSIPLAVDEWNIWWNFPQCIRPRPTLRDTLAAALHLMVFHQRCDLVKIANLSSIINVLPAPILTRKNQVSRTSMFYLFKLFNRHSGEFFLPSTIQGPTYEGKGVRGVRGVRGVKEVTYLAASATADKSGQKVTTFLLNRHHQDEIRVTIDYGSKNPAGEARLITITGPTITAENLPGKPDQIQWIEQIIPGSRAQEIGLPARSISALVQEVGSSAVPLPCELASFTAVEIRSK